MPYYSKLGRKSINPVCMIKILLVGYFYGVKSETRLEVKNLRDTFLLHINDAYSGDISQYNGIGIGVKVNLSTGPILCGVFLGNKKRTNKI